MGSAIEHINLIDGLNINPIPFEFGQEMTATKWLLSIQSKVNSIIDMGNLWETNANNYTDDEVAKVKKLYDEIINLVNTGAIIHDGSVTMKKMDLSFLSDLQNIIIKSVHDATKFVSFSIDKNGYFCADMPDTWDDINFSTDVEGHLCMDIN